LYATLASPPPGRSPQKCMAESIETDRDRIKAEKYRASTNGPRRRDLTSDSCSPPTTNSQRAHLCNPRSPDLPHRAFPTCPFHPIDLPFSEVRPARPYHDWHGWVSWTFGSPGSIRATSLILSSPVVGSAQPVGNTVSDVDCDREGSGTGAAQMTGSRLTHRMVCSLR